MNEYVVEPARRIPVAQADVVVVGGGTAGCIAAVAAARAGAKTYLIEKNPIVGGTYTNGGTGTFSFFSTNAVPEKAHRIVDGIPYEMINRIDALGGFTGFIPTPNESHHCPYRAMSDHEAYIAAVSDMLLEAKVEVLLQTMLSRVVTEDGVIKAIIVENKDGRSAIEANAFVDCTGDGDLARYAGCEQIEHWQDYTQVCSAPTAMVFGMGGIDFEKVVRENPEAAVAKRYPDGRIFCLSFYHTKSPRYKQISQMDVRHYINFHTLHENEATYINCFTGPIINGSSAVAASKAELELRIRNYQLAKAFRECVPGFENSYMNWNARQIGVRNSRITLCDKSLTEQEIEDATRFDDEIGLSGFHDLRARKPECTIREPGYYGFPYRMLVARDCKNLYMAGRCVTEDIEAHMATRNTVGCMVMGQGAGVSAALCAKKNCMARELPYSELRSELLRQNVCLEVNDKT